ncbi:MULTISPECIES: sensor histidine kinase [unclassified Nostoc]|nr:MULTISPECIES: sensor histidine kinase [unclassified Nostoc]
MFKGIGIPLADQKQLFEAFYRGKNTKSIPGTALGLVVVKKCIDLH